MKRALIRRRRLMLTALAAVTVAGVALAVAHIGNHVQPAAPHVTASLRTISLAQANALMPDGNAPVPPAGGELVTGTVTWTPPAHAGGMYVTVYLWDKQTGKAPGMWQATSTAVAINGDPADQRLSQRYSWLAPIGWVRDGKDGWINYAASLTAAPSLGSITFIALFNPVAADATSSDNHHQAAPVDVADLVVAVAYHDVNGDGGWAVRAAG